MILVHVMYGAGANSETVHESDSERALASAAKWLA
jgi:hypothetical protein